MKITKEILEQGKSKRGAWSTKQLKLLGVKWPRTRGWMERLIGTDVPDERVARYLELKDAHLKSKQKFNHLFNT